MNEEFTYEFDCIVTTYDIERCYGKGFSGNWDLGKRTNAMLWWDALASGDELAKAFKTIGLGDFTKGFVFEKDADSFDGCGFYFIDVMDGKSGRPAIYVEIRKL